MIFSLFPHINIRFYSNRCTCVFSKLRYRLWHPSMQRQTSWPPIFTLLPFYGEEAKGRPNGNVVLGTSDAPRDSLDRFDRLPLRKWFSYNRSRSPRSATDRPNRTRAIEAIAIVSIVADVSDRLCNVLI